MVNAYEIKVENDIKLKRKNLYIESNESASKIKMSKIKISRILSILKE